MARLEKGKSENWVTRDSQKNSLLMGDPFFFRAGFPAKARAEVVIYTTDGRILRSGTIEAIWEPPDTLPTDSELQKKFSWLVEPVIGTSKSRKLEALIWELDRVSDARILIESYLLKP